MLGGESSVGGLNLVVTCEHASSRLPVAYGRLGLPKRIFRSHWAYDIGALRVARRLARKLDCAFFAGRYSRLLIDLNRSETHPRVIPKTTGRLPIRINESLTNDEREFRLERYWRPHRRAVEVAIAALSEDPDFCVHIAVHSFTPVLNGVRRECDVGILYDPRRTRERLIAARIRSALRDVGATVRLNYPYRGSADGLTRAVRLRLPRARYAGLEIELNQSLLTERDCRLAAIAGALEIALRKLRGDRAPDAGAHKTGQKPLRNSWERLRRKAISD
jgi:predicted N-formylglutamate amidohydrolase